MIALNNVHSSRLGRQLVDSTRKAEALPGGRLPDVRISPQDRSRVAGRAAVHLRHVFPGAAQAVWSRT